MSSTQYVIKQIFLFLLMAFNTFICNFYFCKSEKSLNISDANDGFSPAVATWYGPPKGPGSGGACGFEDDVGGNTYKGMISAGNQNILKSGFGCGSCYQVRCTGSQLCSGNPVTITITDECPGACNNEPIHFDLSGIAFGAMAKPGQDDALRQLGRIQVEYQKVQCHYPGKYITFKVDKGSNPNYFASAIEYVGGDGGLASVEFKPSNEQWQSMDHSFGATWKIDISPGKTNPPFSIRMTTSEAKRTIIAENVIPTNWAPGQYYSSNVE